MARRLRMRVLVSCRLCVHRNETKSGEYEEAHHMVKEYKPFLNTRWRILTICLLANTYVIENYLSCTFYILQPREIDCIKKNDFEGFKNQLLINEITFYERMLLA